MVFLALLQESSYFYFSQLEAGQERQGGIRREKEAMGARVFEGEEVMQRVVLNSVGKWVTLLEDYSRPAYDGGE